MLLLLVMEPIGTSYRGDKMTFRPYSALQSSGVSDERTNNTGVTINKGTPVRINSSGELGFVNVAVENEVLNIIGVASQSILDGSSGTAVGSGKIEDITTGFALGDTVWLSKSGGLTNIKPSIGINGFVTGDIVVFIGVIAKNESNPALKDLIVAIERQGQL